MTEKNSSKKYLLLLSFVLISFQLKANIDSLQSLFNNTIKINADSAFILNNKIFEYANKNQIDSIKAQAYLNASIVMSRLRLLDSTKYYLDLALVNATHEGPILAEIYKSIGIYYLRISDYENALSYNLKSLKIFEELNDSISIAKVNNNMGSCYGKLDKPEKALYHYKRCYEYGKQDTLIRLSNYINISNLTCIKMKDPSAADLEFLLEGIDFSKKTFNNSKHNVMLYIAGSYYYKKQNDFENAFKYIDSCKAISNEKDYRAWIEIYGQYANLHTQKGELGKSIENLLIAEEFAIKANYPRKLLSIKQSLSDVYSNSNEYEKAYIKLNEYQNLKDSLYDIDKINEINKLQIVHETEEKNKAIELLEKDKLLKDVKLRKSKITRVASLITSILLLMIGILLWLRYKNKIKTDKLIQDALERSFEKKLTEAELQALRAQMNPHFLFNCLNSINSFIIKNEQEKASEYLAKFSKLIRKVLNNSKSSKVTLGDEIEALELYIAMEALRFNDKFTYEINVDDKIELDYIEVPPLIFQPYIENSIWHGLMHKNDGNGILSIAITQLNKTIICTIEDNGIGRKAASLLKSKSATKNKSFGMSITKDRLTYANKDYDIDTNIEIIDLEDKNDISIGTKVIVKIGIE